MNEAASAGSGSLDQSARKSANIPHKPDFSNRRSHYSQSENFRRSSCRAMARLLWYGMNKVTRDAI